MAKFNLKKFSASKKDALETHEKMLQEQRDTQKTELPLPTGITDKLLAETRKGKGADEINEGQLEKVREGKIYNETIEAQIDNHTVGYDAPKRDGKDKYDQLPINLLEEARHQEQIKAFNAASEKKASDDKVGLQDEPNNAKSQLHNNVDRFKKLTEKDVRNNKKVKEMVTASLKDADAMLYYIYHAAAQDNRNLTVEESKLVEGINGDKAELMGLLFE